MFRHKIVLGLVVVTLVLFLFALIVPAWRGRTEARRRVVCIRNLKNIGDAVHSYHISHGSFPPVACTDARGKRLLSWRVLVLPFLGEEDLYRQFKLDESWDSQHNLALLERMPAAYRCPSERHPVATATNYVAVVGKETVFPPSGVVTKEDVSDGIAVTVMLVEIGSSAIPWTKPEDLTFDNLPLPSELLTPHLGLINVLFCDNMHFSVSQTVSPPRNVSPGVWQALMTIRGGETVDLTKI